MIAVLSRSIDFGLKWISRGYDVKIAYYNSGRAVLVNEQTLQVVTKIEDAIGLEFTDYIKAPDYDFLEDFIKTRIKK